MKYTTATLLALAGTLASAQDDSTYGYGSGSNDGAERTCNPSNSSGMPDFNAPCNAIRAIEYQCIYGAAYFNAAIQAEAQSPTRRMLKRQSPSTPSPDGDDNGDDDQGAMMQSNATQRTCVCESQFFDQINGCASCFKAHGNLDPDYGMLIPSAVADLSSSYCAASTTPSAGLADFLFDWANNYNSSHPATGSATATASDKIGNQTAVSLYYTPSVTGSAAWVVAEETSATGSAASFTSENTVSGMIVPTASANNDAAQSGGASGSGSSGSSTSSAGAAVATAAGVGMLGLAGIVALL